MPAVTATPTFSGEEDEQQLAQSSPVRSSSRNDTACQLTVSMLLSYKKRYGDMLVPKIFIVPSTTMWPVETWGEKLGKTTNNIRRGNFFKDRREELVTLGFNFNKNSTKTKGSASSAIVTTVTTTATLDSTTTAVTTGTSIYLSTITPHESTVTTVTISDSLQSQTNNTSIYSQINN